MSKKKKKKLQTNIIPSLPQVYTIDVIEREMINGRCSCGGYLWKLDDYYICGDCHTKFER